ncbi:MAG: PBP1A family penicillin-binding protein [Maricaulaceae bacterium]|jgi:penicillin-binding protein 1A
MDRLLDDDAPPRGPRRPRRPSVVGMLFRAGLVSALVGGLIIAAGVGWMVHVAGSLPQAAYVDRQPPRPSIVVLDRYGREIARRGRVATTDVAIETLPAYLTGAVLAVEDRRFYEHHGLDLRGMARAAWANLRAGRVVQGGSTLTQQLAKNLFLDSERTLTRKAKEITLALWIDQNYDKDRILEVYLNRVYFGSGAWGIEAAAQRYFGKSASEVTLGEAALLAGLLKAPSRYSPINDVERAEARASVVLEVMYEAGAITEAERDAAFAEPVHVMLDAEPMHAGYFVDWAVAEARERTGGITRDLVIHTTLDDPAQLAAEASVAEVLGRAESRAAGEAALVALDGDGAVRAMVGGRSYTESQFNRATQANRQPGSAFKPFVYAAAIEAGLSPWDVRSDAPITLGDWTPTNYDEEFVGDVALITALADSINTVAVRVAEEIGRDRVVDLVERLGVGSRVRPTRSMALGSHEMTPLEATAAYAAFANGGYAVEPYAITSIEDSNGVLLWRRPEPAFTRGLDQRTSALMNLMLARVVTDGTGRRAALPGREVAGKTGTTNDFRDAWFIGYVPGYVAGVWVGNDDFTPMDRVTGGTAPAEIWRSFMEVALEDAPVAPLETEPDPMAALIAESTGQEAIGTSSGPLAGRAERGMAQDDRNQLESLLDQIGSF